MLNMAPFMGRKTLRVYEFLILKRAYGLKREELTGG
jgi:hypothetical protein